MKVRLFPAALLALGLFAVSPAVLAQGAPKADDWSAGKAQSFWQYESIGDVQGVAGQTFDKDAKTYTMTAGGADTWGTADAFNYLYQSVSGDWQITLHVADGFKGANEDGYSKGGLMVRSSTDPAAANLYLFESPNRFGVGWEGRLTDGVGTAFGENPSTLKHPIYLRLARSAGAFYAFVSPDGKVFTQVGTPQTLANYTGLDVSPVLVGIATCAHTTDAAKFVTVTYGPVTAEALTGTLSGTLVTLDGAAMPNRKVTVKSDTQTWYLTSDAEGKYTINLTPGAYKVSANDVGIESDEQTAEVKAGATATVKVTGGLLVTLSLATADGAAWKIFAYPTDADAPEAATDVAPAAPSFSDTAWASVDVPSEVNGGNPVVDNSYFWYRVKFKLPAGFSDAKDRALVVAHFKLDDSDATYLNGKLLGATAGWDTERRYTVLDPSLISYTGDNVLAIKGHQGGGGGGIDQAGWAPIVTLYPVSMAIVSGSVWGAANVGAEGATVTLTSAEGKAVGTTTVAQDGTYVFKDLIPGAYSITVAAPTATAVTPTSVAVTAVGGRISKAADVNVTYQPFFPATVDAAVSDDFSKNTTSNWTSVDIGDPDPGDFSINTANKQMVVHADGADIWDGGDHFRYTYKTVSGDFVATLKVVNVPTSDGWAKAGLMVRNTLDPNSQHALVCATRDNGEYLQARPKA
ncbi:MAG TPA: carboxypeptidase-like regulatory domain-containing protein, partial [Armatimonadota bacterium]